METQTTKEKTCKHAERYYIYDCDGFICETCKKEVNWVDVE